MEDHHWAFDKFRDPNCPRCGLGPPNGDLRCLMGVGPPNADIMFIGEAPGRREIEPDIRRPFAGPAGKYLDKVLEAVGLPREEIFITNVIACHPPGNRDPLPEEIRACSYFLEAQIQAVRPKKILALGNIALKALTGRSGIAEHRGKTFQVPLDDSTYIKLVATYHPSYVRSNPKMYPLLFTDLMRVKGGSNSHIETHYSPIESMTTFRNLIRELLTSPEVSFDLETTHLDPWKVEGDPPTGAEIICISLSNREGWGYVVPLEGTWGSMWSDDNLKEIYRLLSAVLTNPKTHIIAFNSKFDLLWLWSRGIKARCDYDPYVAAVLLDENLPHSLEASVQLYIDPGFSKLEPKKISIWRWEDIWNYSAGDADWTLRLAHTLHPLLAKEPTSERLFSHLIMPIQTKVLPKLELGGIYIHEDKLDEADIRCTGEISRWNAEIKGYVPPDYVPPVKSKKSLKRGFNPGSTKQLADLLFNVLGLPPGALTEGGDFSTSESVLIDLRGKHPIIEPIGELRKFSKYKSTYIDTWREERDPNGFIHPHYHLKPVTGRLSSEFQQVPREGLIRNCVGAPPGFKLLVFDYSQIEMRIAAHYSKDPELIRVYQAGEDIHLLTATMVSGLPVEQITKELRKKAKAVNFGLIFGMGAYKLMEYAKEKYEVYMTIDEATDYRMGFFTRYAALVGWHRDQIRKVREHHQVVSMIGRVRHLNNILSADWEVVAEAERQGINSVVQGLASDLTLMSAVEVDKVLPPHEGRLVGLVHDAALYMIRDDKVDYWKVEIKRIMENPPLHLFTEEKFLVPIVVDCEVSSTWG